MGAISQWTSRDGWVRSVSVEGERADRGMRRGLPVQVDRGMRRDLPVQVAQRTSGGAVVVAPLLGCLLRAVLSLGRDDAPGRAVIGGVLSAGVSARPPTQLDAASEPCAKRERQHCREEREEQGGRHHVRARVTAASSRGPARARARRDILKCRDI